ncbi:unnamed protein product [Dovyalis caffra]|uniref:Uncharacterized protein n=1 Tax=Dovyalis caffra TaxID=77055 RepID=A0AAV1RKT7_9ROSI|nr:unnamed protein product [Dovyalis caffra]
MMRSIRGFGNVGPGNNEVNNSEMEGFCRCVDQMFSKVDALEQRVNSVESFYANNKQLNTAKCSSILKDKIKDKHLMTIEKQQQDSEKRMQDLMRQFAVLFRQASNLKFPDLKISWSNSWSDDLVCGTEVLISMKGFKEISASKAGLGSQPGITQHKWAWPFMEPVDVEGLGLHDYYENDLCTTFVREKRLLWMTAGVSNAPGIVGWPYDILSSTSQELERCKIGSN